tara:strand:- start:201 stop:449 length:249 start_codon:yes stop_codon:yes gene_type:complete
LDERRNTFKRIKLIESLVSATTQENPIHLPEAAVTTHREKETDPINFNKKLFLLFKAIGFLTKYTNITPRIKHEILIQKALL